MLGIIDSVFGKMCYEHRWTKEENVNIFGKTQTIKICAKSFNEKPITDSQRASYLKINIPRRRASGYVVLIRYRSRVLYPLYDAERRGIKPSARIKKNLDDILNECADKIYDYLNKFYNVKLENRSKINEHVQFTHIIFMQNGDAIFLFDSDYDMENGIGIQIYPEMEIGPQDAFI